MNKTKEFYMKYIIVKESDYGSFYVENNNNSIEDKATAENLANAMQKAVDLKEGNKAKYHAVEIPQAKLKVAINE
mgnify:FL=1